MTVILRGVIADNKENPSWAQRRQKGGVIYHVAFEDPGSFESIPREAGYDIEYLGAGSDDLGVIRAETDELLITLGGPISVNDIDEYPFIQG